LRKAYSSSLAPVIEIIRICAFALLLLLLLLLLLQLLLLQLLLLSLLLCSTVAHCS
jgi:hypothetical protein